MDTVTAKQLTEVLSLLEAFSNLSSINSTFLPAFNKGILKKDGIRYLHGTFNLGKVVSGRLSSSDPNLTNLPSSKSAYAKPIKKIFKGNKEWLMCGADFNSLEDMISALQTKDPNKLKIYEEGFDGHSLRAHAYFPKELGHIPLTVKGINSIADLYPDSRQLSKAPTFLLTYLGTRYGLEYNLGFSKEQSAAIEKNYHKLYVVSDEWVEAEIAKACKNGYITGAFGLKLRTPVLQRTVLHSAFTPQIAKSEMRTAGNMLGQSYGLLTTRALNAFMKLVWNSKYKYDVKPIASIHDALYFMIKNNIDVMQWVNTNLIKCMQWQELDAIRHDTVKLGASLELYPYGWHNPMTVPNNASNVLIRELVYKFKQENLCPT